MFHRKLAFPAFMTSSYLNALSERDCQQSGDKSKLGLLCRHSSEA